MIWNIRKQKTTNHNKKIKKNPSTGLGFFYLKNKGSISSLWENFKRSNIFIQEYQKDKRKSKKLEIYLKK